MTLSCRSHDRFRPQSTLPANYFSSHRTIAAFFRRSCTAILDALTDSSDKRKITSDLQFILACQLKLENFKGRLNSEAGGGAWCPRDAIGGKDGKEEFLEIDLLVDHIIHSVVTQGRFANGLGQEYVDQYTLQFWREGTDNFMDYLDGEVLQGNTNTYQAVEHVLHGPSVIASKIR